MMDTDRCPECESLNTERVMVDFWTNQVQEVRVCNDCPTQYDVMYGRPVKENVTVMDE